MPMAVTDSFLTVAESREFCGHSWLSAVAVFGAWPNCVVCRGWRVWATRRGLKAESRLSELVYSGLPRSRVPLVIHDRVE